ncbi:hypothetical protein H0H92_008358 [Tricholoma furcatifolium]|nr:hypothetical protein H0H92_008358 [Tricholoma furcatifolium]
MSILRVGGIIPMENFQCLEILPLLCKANVDLYLYWGPISGTPLIHDAFVLSKGIVPNYRDIDNLRKIAKAGPVAKPTINVVLPTPKASPSVEAAAAAASIPEPERYSGQKHGEDWRTFFKRREEGNKAREMAEEPKQKQSRLQREQHASHHLCPGRKGSRVFYWEDMDGFRIRRAAGRKRYDLIWEDYRNSQRRYDGFRDEWDLCTEFGDEDDPANSVRDDDDSDYDADDLPTELFPDNNDWNNRLNDHHQYSSRADLHRVYPSSEEDGQLSTMYQTLEDTAYFRFGFVSPLGTSRYPSDPPNWKRVREYLGDGHWPPTQRSPDPNIQTRESLQGFFGYFKSSRDVSGIPAEIHDVSQDSSDVNTRPLQFYARKEKLHGVLYYLIRSKAFSIPEDASFEIGLKNPAVLLEIVRRELGRQHEDICNFLLDFGIPFKTFIPGPQKHLPAQMIPRYGGLGFRPQNYKPDVIDYRAYVASRDNLLRGPLGRAALMAGGILFRLASDSVSRDAVHYGPSDTVFNHGRCHWSGQASSPAYWDDTLMEDDTDVICGVYRVGTNQQSGDGPQTADLSWWPKPSIWEGSGLNAGCWTVDCETWYQDRLAKCLAGTADLKNPSAWRHSLRFVKDVAHMAQKNDTLAQGLADRISLHK